MSTLFDRMSDGPYGLWGGSSGAPCGIFVCPAGETEFRTAVELFGTVSPSKFVNIRLKRGDKILVLSPGGGGYGAPQERAEAALQQDLEDGFITAAGLQAYGRG